MSEQTFDIERHYLRNIKTSILKNPKLREIRSNIRALFRIWYFKKKDNLWEYQENLLDKYAKHPSYKNDKLIKKVVNERKNLESIYKKSLLNDGDKDMIYNPFHDEWFTKEDFNFFQTYFEVDIKKFMKDYSRPDIKGIQLEIVEDSLWRDRDVLFPLFKTWGADFSEEESGTFLNIPQDRELKDSIGNNIKTLVFGNPPGERIDDSSIHTALDIIENRNSSFLSYVRGRKNNS